MNHKAPNRSQLIALGLHAGGFSGATVAASLSAQSELSGLYVALFLIVGFIVCGFVGWALARIIAAPIQQVLPSGRPQTLLVSAISASFGALLALGALSMVAPALGASPGLVTFVVAATVALLFGLPGTAP